jgi:carboxypeptidase T
MKRSKLMFALLTAAALGPAALPLRAQQTEDLNDLMEQEKRQNDVFKAWFPDLATARRAAISFHGELLESRYDEGYLVLQLDAAQREQLQRFGFVMQPATEFIAKRNDMLTRLQSRAKAQGREPLLLGRQADAEGVGALSIPGFSCYETVEETFADAQALVAGFPQLARWIDVGNSWQKTEGAGGYDIRVLKLTNEQVPGAKPKLFINSAIHAREYVTAPLVLAFAKQLVEGYGRDADATWILDQHEVHLMLHTNPDGRKKAESGLLWRKNTNTNYCGPNSVLRGADLNRNFSYSWNATNGIGSSGNQCSEVYRGPQAASEPEVRAVQRYVRSLWPDRRGPGLNDAAPADTSGIHLDIHSFSELVLWPWGLTDNPAPNGTALQTLGRKFAWFNGYTPTQSIGLYPTDGTSDSASYGELGVAAFTFELGTDFFQSCGVYNSTIKPRNLPALLYAAKVVRTPYQTPAGPDVSGLALSPAAPVRGGRPVLLTGSATDIRFNNSNGTEPTQAIAQAEAYIDTPPWRAGAAARALRPADGAFDGKTEGLRSMLSTNGLSPGRHIVYVRARDAQGNWGAISAVFLRVRE